MGDLLFAFYRKHVTKEYRIAFLVTWIGGLLIHSYKFLNYLPNYDSILNIYHNQNMLESGRWALSLACGISSYFDLPWVIGLLSCTYMALTAVVVVAVLQIKKPMVIALTGLCLVSAPATTQIFVFLFTADGYLLGLLLAAWGVYFSRIPEKRISRHVIGALCICISCGIYQANVAFALVLSLVYFMDVLLHERYEKKACLKWVLRQAVMYAVALAVYFALWEGLMLIAGTSANDYLGMSRIGQDLQLFRNIIIEPIKNVIRYYLQNNILKHGPSLYAVLNILNLMLLAFAVITACVKSRIYKRPWALTLFVLCILAIIPFSCYCNWASNDVIYQARMLQGLILVFVLSLILVEDWTGRRVKALACMLLLVTVGHYALMANISYFYMERSYERTYAEGIEIMNRVYDLQEEHEIKRIVVIGERTDAYYTFFDPETGRLSVPGQVQVILSVVSETMIVGKGQTEKFLDYAFNLSLEPLEHEEGVALLETSPEVQNMGCWPAKDSVSVVDDILVIKFDNKADNPEYIPPGGKYH